MPREKLLREWECGGRRWRLVDEGGVTGLHRVYLLRDDGRGWCYADHEGDACEKRPILEENVHDRAGRVELAERAEKIGRRASREWARRAKVREVVTP